MNNFIKNIIIGALLFAVGYLLFRGCEQRQEFIDFKEKSTEKFENYNAELFDKEQRIYRGQVLIEEKNKRIQELIDTIDHIKPTIITKVTTNTKIDTVLVPFEKPVYRDLDGTKWLAVPQKFSRTEQWYAISGVIDNTGVQFDSLWYKNDFYIATGKEDHGSFVKNLFKRRNTVVQIKDNNPYTSTQQLSQTFINERKHKFHIGPSIGWAQHYGGQGIYFGAGLTYSLISF